MVFALGKTGNYLEITTGNVTNNITKMAREGIKFPLSNAIRNARKSNSEVIVHNVKLDINGILIL